MARYNGPVCRLCRREGMKLFLKGERCYTEKCAIEKRNVPPGQHGRSRKAKMVGYAVQLREKQKVKRIYGVAAQAQAEGRLQPARQREALQRADGLALGAHEPARRRSARSRRWPPRRSASCAGTRRTGCPRSTSCSSRALDDDDEVWLKIRIPQRPNGRTGWVREEQLSNLKVVTTHLTIDRSKLRATLRKGGKVIWRSPIGVGAPGHADARRAGSGSASGFATSAAAPSTARGRSARPRTPTLSDWPGGGVVGIHGTNEPELIPGRPSHGCVRVPERARSRGSRGSCRSGRRSSSSETARAPARRRRQPGLPRRSPRASSRASSRTC